MKLSGKVAVITGGGTGLGRASALAMAAEGARIVLNGRRPEPIRAVAAEISALGGEGAWSAGDAGTADTCSQAVSLAMERFGRLDVALCCVGALELGTVEETTEDLWYRMIDLNLTCAFQLSRFAFPAMRSSGGGTILTVSSAGGMRGFGSAVAYATAKGALFNFTRSVAAAGAPYNIRANTLVPGTFQSDALMNGLRALNEDKVAQFLQDLDDQTPLGLGKPELVAPTVVFLASDDARWATGATFTIDGGIMMYPL